MKHSVLKNSNSPLCKHYYCFLSSCCKNAVKAKSRWKIQLSCRDISHKNRKISQYDRRNCLINHDSTLQWLTLHTVHSPGEQLNTENLRHEKWCQTWINTSCETLYTGIFTLRTCQKLMMYHPVASWKWPGSRLYMYNTEIHHLENC